jgi:2',3'-cyclic-nucleotide 2'-phosphodiesterase (5'-nucleotidase family)
MKPMNRRRMIGTVIGLTAGFVVAPAIYRFSLARAADLRALGEQNLNIENELTTRNARSEESNLADIVVDAIRNVEKSDAAFMHGSAFGDTTIAKGKATAADLLKAVQYREDTVVVVKLTGEQIRRALENAVKLHPQKSPEFLQVSGLSVTVNANAEKDKRILEVRVGASKLDEKKTYSVAMPSPLANGALGYYKIWDKARAIDHETSKTVGQALTDHLTGKTQLGAKTEERIAFK